jgi:hypothetical protein
MIRVSEQVKFAVGGNVDLLMAWEDLYNHYRAVEQKKTNLEYDTKISFSEKEAKFNAELKKIIIKRSGVPYAAEEPVEKWFSHPSIVFETFAIVGALIDYILPISIIDTIGLYADIVQGGFGDSFKFEVAPRDLFLVSKSGKAQKRAEIHKQFSSPVTVVPEMHEISVGVSLYRVLCGMESLASFAAKAVRSMEYQMAKETYDLFVTTMTNLATTSLTGLRVSGWTSDAFVDLAQRIEAFNNGAKPVAVGTQRALAHILPDEVNYRYDLSGSDYVKLGYVRTFMGYDTLALPQLADWTNPFAALISSSYIWLLSPSSQKLIKLCLEGTTLSRSDGPFDNANLTQATTLQKSWGLVVATNAIAGEIDL